MDGPVEFTFNWVAPESPLEAVLFNAVGNASDASGDPSGDQIYTASAYSGAAGAGIEAPPKILQAKRRTREQGLNFSNRLVNLPTTRPVHRGLFEYVIAHRFTYPIFQEGSPSQAFGLDSAANVTFGFHYGLGKDIAVSVYREKFNKTIDLGAEYTPVQQGDGIPVSLLARVGLAGRDNFGMSPADFRPPDNQYQFSPYIQLSTSRSFHERFSLYAVPTMIFNSRDEAYFLFDPGFEAQHNHTFSLGLGGSLRLTSSSFLLGEYIPRIWGFRGFFTDRPSVSVGVQKNTFGHTFALILSTSPGLIASDYSVEGKDTFRIAFNIYRRMR